MRFKIYSMRFIYLLVFSLFSSFVFSQYKNKDSNHIGISAGVSQLSLFSDQFNATPGQGFIGGFSLRGNYYNNWQAVYGMHFSQSTFSLESVTNKEIDFTMEAVQIYFCFSYRVIENHLNLEIGPILQVNGKLKIDKDDELALLKDSPLVTAEELTDITKINGNLYAGITAGIKHVRLHVSYQYGFNNIMNNLNKNNDLKTLNGEKFKGNIGLLSAMITVYL